MKIQVNLRAGTETLVISETLMHFWFSIKLSLSAFNPAFIDALIRKFLRKKYMQGFLYVKYIYIYTFTLLLLYILYIAIYILATGTYPKLHWNQPNVLSLFSISRWAQLRKTWPVKNCSLTEKTKPSTPAHKCSQALSRVYINAPG